MFYFKGIMMFDKLKNIKEKYEKLQKQLYDPQTTSNIQKTIKIQKEISQIEEIYNLYKEWLNIQDQIKEAKQILETEDDEDILQLAKEQLSEAEEKKENIEKQLKIALLPKDPNDDKNIFMEIRPAAWWDEAWLFAAELLRMYLRYAEKKWWKAIIEEEQLTPAGSLKFALVKITGNKVYSKLKYESWVHRVQRIPVTESTWRIHTSTATVAILPEVDDIDFKLNMDEIQIDTYAASSAWWQHANKNETWIRVHHIPTWIIVTCNDWRSQLKNKEKALSVLKSKLYQMELEKQQKQLREQRLYQLGTGDRSEKIRTYNYPQDRVTDHRIKKSWWNLPAILDWDLDPIIEELIIEDQSKLLSSTEN